MTFIDLSAESGSMASVRVGAGRSGFSSLGENAAMAARAAKRPTFVSSCLLLLLFLVL
jgi:hypothetical protein